MDVGGALEGDVVTAGNRTSIDWSYQRELASPCLEQHPQDDT